MTAPKLTQEVIDSLRAPLGTIVYNVTINDFQIFDDNIWKTLTGGSGGGTVTADNGLTETTGNVQLGGDLIKDTLVGGAFLLELGQQLNPLRALETFSTEATVFNSNDGTRSSNLQLDPTFFNLRHFNVGTASISFEDGNGDGIFVTDTIDEMGLNGAVDFSNNYVSTSYVQQGWVTTQIDNVREYLPVQEIGNGMVLPNYTMDLFNITQIINGTVTITLPDLLTAGRNLKYTFKHVGSANTITIVPTGLQRIDGQTSVVLSTQYEVLTVLSSNNNWYII